MVMDPNHLTCLLAIARTGSFSKAAAELGQSQPTISNTIALLERRLGAKVLERTKRGSTLTPQGEILVRRAEGIHALLEHAESEVRNFEQHIEGPLKIGATPSVLPFLLPVTLARIRTGASEIEIIDGSDHLLVPQLRTGSLDVIIGPVEELFTNDPEITETALLDDPFCVAVSEQSRHFAKQTASLREFSEDRWILPQAGSTYRRHVESLFMTAGVRWPTNCIYANSLPLLEAMICFAGHVSIVSPVQIRPPVSGFKVLSLKDGGHRKIGYKLRAKGRLSGLGQQFIEAFILASREIADNPGLRKLGLRAG